MIALYKSWIDRYPIVSIEDGLAEDDWAGWAKLTEALAGRVQLVGDDLFCTNVSRLARGIEVFHALKRVLGKRGLSTAVGDEGGFAPNLLNDEAALQAIMSAIEEAGYEAGKDVGIALDVAASELYADGAYTFKKSGAGTK